MATTSNLPPASGQGSQTLRLFLSFFSWGVSLAISHSRARPSAPNGSLFAKYLLRALKILGYGMLLTLASWFTGIGVIVFGILHLIGVSIMLVYPFLGLRLANLIFGLGVIAVGWYVQTLTLLPETAWFLPLGLVPDGLFMLDYRPLLPWFGVVLLGICTGNLLYGGRERAFAMLVKEPLIPGC